ncbi:MAG: RNA polymerase sigma factor [Anaerolineae bacterium]
MLENVINHITAKRHSSIAGIDDFAQLYREHTDAIFNYCLFRVGDRAVAEDLTADTFERAWQARHRYQSERADFTTWLFTIARHVVIDWQRRRSRRPVVALDERQPDRDPLPEVQVVEAERRSRLRRLVQALDLHEQELIALKFGAGMTNRDIAQVAGKSETASRPFRGRQPIRPGVSCSRRIANRHGAVGGGFSGRWWSGLGPPCWSP